jgi:hypothetical protein
MDYHVSDVCRDLFARECSLLDARALILAILERVIVVREKLGAENYGDIKLENMLFGNNGEVFVVDVCPGLVTPGIGCPPSVQSSSSEGLWSTFVCVFEIYYWAAHRRHLPWLEPDFHA